MGNIAVTIDGRQFEIELLPLPTGSDYIAIVDGEEIPVYVPSNADPAQPDWLVVDNRPYEFTLDHDLHWIDSYHGRHRLEVRDLDASVARPVSADGRVKAPIPGLITRVMVEEGQAVEAGQPILILEAMKMENEIRAPLAGQIQQLAVEPGRTVVLDELMIEIA